MRRFFNPLPSSHPMKYLSLLPFFLILISPVHSQEPTATTPPPSANFVLIHDAGVEKETYLLNRYSGATWRLVADRNVIIWEKVPAKPNGKDVIPAKSREPVFQISIQRQGAKETYLINTSSGITWILRDDRKGGKYWEVIPATPR